MQQLDLFNTTDDNNNNWLQEYSDQVDASFIKFHKDTESMSKRTADSLDRNFGDITKDITPAQYEIVQALSSQDYDRAIELIEIQYETDLDLQ